MSKQQTQEIQFQANEDNGWSLRDQASKVLRPEQSNHRTEWRVHDPQQNPECAKSEV